MCESCASTKVEELVKKDPMTAVLTLIAVRIALNSASKHLQESGVKFSEPAFQQLLKVLRDDGEAFTRATKAGDLASKGEGGEQAGAVAFRKSLEETGVAAAKTVLEWIKNNPEPKEV